MSRHLYGGTADYAITIGADDVATLQPGVEVTCWSAGIGGEQYTDLIEVDGQTPVESLVTDEFGAVPEFHGPPGVSTLYLSAGGGPRRRAVPTDAASGASDAITALVSHEGQPNPHSMASYHLVDAVAPSIEQMLDQDTWEPAHRLSGGEFGEFTEAGLTALLAAGCRDFEMSCVLTADGVLVLNHDTSLNRTSTGTGLVSGWTYAQLSQLVRITPAGILGQGYPEQEILTVRRALDRVRGHGRVWLEAKVGAAVDPMFALLDEHFPGWQRWVIVKTHHGASATITKALARDATVWAYLDVGTNDTTIAALETQGVQILGVPGTMSDARIGEIVGREAGLPVQLWECHRHIDYERCDMLGVRGRMTSQWLYLNAPVADLAEDVFARRISVPGTLGTVAYSEAHSPQYTSAGAVYLPNTANRSIMLGRYRPASGTTHVLRWWMRWPALPGDALLHAGIYFCRDKDDPFRFGISNTEYAESIGSPGAYRAFIRRNGDFALSVYTRGSTSGTALGGGAIATPAPVADEWMEFEAQVSPTQVIVRRLDGPGAPYTITSGNTARRGRGWGFCGGSSDTTVEWAMAQINPT
jgi:hypothetical protein